MLAVIIAGGKFSRVHLIGAHDMDEHHRIPQRYDPTWPGQAVQYVLLDGAAIRPIPCNNTGSGIHASHLL